MQLSDIQVLIFEITSYCNIKCPQCSRTDEDGNLAKYVELKHWEVETVLSNLEVDKLTNLKFVHFEGDTGDALMHPQFEELVKAFYNLPSKPDIDVLTNGALRSIDWWYNLGTKFDFNRFRVQFSIDGLEDTHKLYRVGADYTKAIDNARAFIQGGGNAAQRCLVFKHNEHQLEKITQTSIDIGFDQFTLMPNDHYRFRGLSRWPVFVDGVNTHYIESTDLQDFSKYNYNKSGREWYPAVPNITNVKSQTCPAFKQGKITVTYKGHVIPCCMYNADLYFDHPLNQKFKNLIGDIEQIDIHKNKLSDIISKTYFNNLNTMLEDGDHPGRCDVMCGNVLSLKPKEVYFIPATKR